MQHRTSRRAFSILAFTLALTAGVGFLAGCSDGGGGSPTEPAGPRLVLTADSSTISPFGETLIAAQALGAQGEPLAGRAVHLTTDLGTIALTPVITEDNGIAYSRLHGDGTEGRATVVGRIAGSDTEGQVQVAINRTAPISVDVRPSVIAPFGSAEIFVLLRQSNGTIPPVGTQVQLSTNLGRITEPTPKTDSLGVARSRIDGRGDEGTATIRALRRDTGDEATTALELESDLVLELRATRDSLPVSATLTLVATVSTPSGVPAGEGTRVEFSATAGQLAASRVSTNALGVAETQWTAPSQPGNEILRAQIVGTFVGANLTIVVTSN